MDDQIPGHLNDLQETESSGGNDDGFVIRKTGQLQSAMCAGCQLLVSDLRQGWWHKGCANTCVGLVGAVHEALRRMPATQ